MSNSKTQGLLGEITQIVAAVRVARVAAFHAGSENDPQLAVLRPTKRRIGGCKTCQGRGCNGHCKF